MIKKRKTVGLWAIGSALFLATLGPAMADSGASDDPYPKLKLLTDRGQIEVELFTDAAPEATARLLALSAQGPAELKLQDVWPLSRVVSSKIPQLENPPVPIEIDALSLGLDQQLILDPGAAMSVLQDEIMPVHLKNKQSPPTEVFGQWIRAWRAEREPSFLLGLDRKQLLEGFGFVYRHGLASRPVERGSVLLRPSSPDQADSRLVFSLDHRPLKTGRWMVIGRVTEGLELLRDLSVSPLTHPVAKSGRLAQPAVVRSITLQTATERSLNNPAPGSTRLQDHPSDYTD